MTRAPRRLAVLVVALSALALLAACSDDDDDTEATSTPSATASAPATATPTASALATVSPTPRPQTPLAPDGRTGDAEIDGLIEALRTEDAAALEARFGNVEASYYGLVEGELQFVPAAELAPRFAAAERSLYAVTLRDRGMSPAADYDITLAVHEAGRELEGWRFALLDGRIVDITFGHSPPSAAVVSVSGITYDRFLVLPPAEFLPQPPPGHPLAVRSGDDGVDTLLALIEAGDTDALLAAVDGFARRECGQQWEQGDAASAARRLRELPGRGLTLHAVAEVPERTAGPAADHSLMLIVESAPFEWDSWALLERDGRIVGMEGSCTTAPQLLYPPLAMLAPPPPAGEEPDPARRSGHAPLDAVLDALAAHDSAALEAVVDYEQIGCIVEPQGIGQPPFCEGAETEGTLIDALLFAECEGYYQRPPATREALERIAPGSWVLYAANDLGLPDQPSAFERGHVQAVLVELLGGEISSGFALFVSDEGITSIWYGCGPQSPDSMLRPGRAPSFLIAPPPE